MKKTLSAAAVAAACCVPFAVFAQAAAAPAKVEPEYTFAGNAGLFSDYRFRGFSQTDYNPAFQGGIDFAHKSGFYLVNWNSNVNSTLSSIIYNGASLEMDFYGGYKATFGDFVLDVGTIYYFYPGTGQLTPGVDAKNWEVYVGGSYGPVSLKYYYSFTDFFGLNSDALGLPGGIDTKGSQYLDLSGTYDLVVSPAVSTPRGRSTWTSAAPTTSAAVGVWWATSAGSPSRTRKIWASSRTASTTTSSG